MCHVSAAHLGILSPAIIRPRAFSFCDGYRIQSSMLLLSPPASFLWSLLKKNGEHPSKMAVFVAVRDCRAQKAKRGRKAGWTKITRDEDKVIMTAFHKARPPGFGVESRDAWMVLPHRLRDKICLRTVRKRLKAKGFVHQRKVQKSDPGVLLRSAQLAFCQSHAHRTAGQ